MNGDIPPLPHTPFQSTHGHLLNFTQYFNTGGPRQLSRYRDSLRARRFGDRIPGGEIFRTRPDLPKVPPSLLYNGYRVSFPGVKRLGRDNHPATSSAEVKERVELYLYSTSGPSWPVLWRTLQLPFSNTCAKSTIFASFPSVLPSEHKDTIHL